MSAPFVDLAAAAAQRERLERALVLVRTIETAGQELEELLVEPVELNRGASAVDATPLPEQGAADETPEPSSEDGPVAAPAAAPASPEVSRETRDVPASRIAYVRRWFLERDVDWYAPAQVAAELGIHTKSVSNTCRRLVDLGELEHNGRRTTSSRYRLRGDEEPTPPPKSTFPDAEEVRAAARRAGEAMATELSRATAAAHQVGSRARERAGLQPPTSAEITDRRPWSGAVARTPENLRDVSAAAAALGLRVSSAPIANGVSPRVRRELERERNRKLYERAKDRRLADGSTLEGRIVAALSRRPMTAQRLVAELGIGSDDDALRDLVVVLMHLREEGELRHVDPPTDPPTYTIREPALA